MTEPRELALIAAEAATNGLAELLRFVREGALSDSFVFAEDTIEYLAEALKVSIDIEYAATVARGDAEGAKMLDQLTGACTRFLDGWA